MKTFFEFYHQDNLLTETDKGYSFVFHPHVAKQNGVKSARVDKFDNGHHIRLNHGGYHAQIHYKQGEDKPSLITVTKGSRYNPSKVVHSSDKKRIAVSLHDVAHVKHIDHFKAVAKKMIDLADGEHKKTISEDNLSIDNNTFRLSNNKLKLSFKTSEITAAEAKTDAEKLKQDKTIVDYSVVEQNDNVIVIVTFPTDQREDEKVISSFNK